MLDIVVSVDCVDAKNILIIVVGGDGGERCLLY